MIGRGKYIFPLLYLSYVEGIPPDHTYRFGYELEDPDAAATPELEEVRGTQGGGNIFPRQSLLARTGKGYPWNTLVPGCLWNT